MPACLNHARPARPPRLQLFHVWVAPEVEVCAELLEVGGRPSHLSIKGLIICGTVLYCIGCALGAQYFTACAVLHAQNCLRWVGTPPSACHVGCAPFLFIHFIPSPRATLCRVRKLNRRKLPSTESSCLGRAAHPCQAAAPPAAHWGSRGAARSRARPAPPRPAGPARPARRALLLRLPPPRLPFLLPAGGTLCAGIPHRAHLAAGRCTRCTRCACWGERRSACTCATPGGGGSGGPSGRPAGVRQPAERGEQPEQRRRGAGGGGRASGSSSSSRCCGGGRASSSSSSSSSSSRCCGGGRVSSCGSSRRGGWRGGGPRGGCHNGQPECGSVGRGAPAL